MAILNYFKKYPYYSKTLIVLNPTIVFLNKSIKGPFVY